MPDIKRLGMLLVRDEQQPAARLQCLESNCPIAMIDKVAHNRKLGKRLAQTAQLGEKNTGRDKQLGEKTLGEIKRDNYLLIIYR